MWIRLLDHTFLHLDTDLFMRIRNTGWRLGRKKGLSNSAEWYARLFVEDLLSHLSLRDMTITCTPWILVTFQCVNIAAFFPQYFVNPLDGPTQAAASLPLVGWLLAVDWCRGRHVVYRVFNLVWLTRSKDDINVFQQKYFSNKIKYWFLLIKNSYSSLNYH